MSVPLSGWPVTPLPGSDVFGEVGQAILVVAVAVLLAVFGSDVAEVTLACEDGFARRGC